jgi:hypothetical protein
MNEEDRDGLRGSVDSVETRSGTGTDGGESPVSRTMARRTFLTVTAAAGTAGLAATGCGGIGSGGGDVGGKGIRGPNSTGILAGRRVLIEAARMQNAPDNGIGRGLKVGKEEIVGVVTALERYIALDEGEQIAEWNRKAGWLADQLQDIPGLEARYELNTHGYFDVELVWDEAVIPLSRDDLGRKLMEGDPRIRIEGNLARTLQLEPGEEILVARRLRELFTTGNQPI